MRLCPEPADKLEPPCRGRSARTPDRRIGALVSVIRHFRYHNTNCYFMACAGGWLAIDAGWPGTLSEYRAHSHAHGVPLEAVRHALVTHFHLDHAGLFGEFQLLGIECVVFEEQLPHIAPMEATITRGKASYQPIDSRLARIVSLRESAAFLEGIGVRGEVIATAGHSPDSVTLLTADHEAFIGDLYTPQFVMPDDVRHTTIWSDLIDRGVKQVYPAHVLPFEL